MPRVYEKDDGTLVAINGTNNNCGGIGRIVVKITPNQTQDFFFSTTNFECEHFDGFGRDVAGAHLPEFIKKDVCDGARQAFSERQNAGEGINFELINASAGITDFPGTKFFEAGFAVVQFWFANYARR